MATHRDLSTPAGRRAHRRAILRRGVRKSVRGVAVLIGVTALGTGIIFALSLYLHPWAASVTGGPLLTGYWHGEVTFAPDDVRPFVLRLDNDTWPGRGGHGHGSDIDGEARLCGAAQHTTYEVWGDPHDRSGSTFSLRARAQGDRYGPGRYLQNLDGDPDIEGRWHGDRLTLRVAVANHQTVGSAHPEAPVEVTMLRSTEDAFAAAC